VGFCVTLRPLNHKKKIKAELYESVKLKKEIVDMIRENKKKTGVPIKVYIEMLVTKDLDKNE